MINAHYGDYHGEMLNQLIITKEFISDQELLEFLADNTINIFMYDPLPQRGCTNVLDYALSVGKPIDISDSNMCL